MNFTNISLEKLNCIYVAEVTDGIELLNFYWSGSVKYFLLLIAYNLLSLMKQQQWTAFSFNNGLTATNEYDLYL